MGVNKPVKKTKRATIEDVARKAGLSKTAVSFVFNGRSGVSAESQKRIMQAAEELGWRPDARARALSLSQTHVLGLVVKRDPSLLSTDPFFAGFVSGVQMGLAEHNYSLMLQVVSDTEAERLAYQQLVREAKVDGVFLTDLETEDFRPRLLTTLRIPIVVVGPPSHETENVAAVEMNDAAGVKRAVQHLAALGHKVIGHVSGNDKYVHTRSRRDAWIETLEELGLPQGPYISADFTGEGGARATHELLDLPNAPTAIVYGNDLMAIAGMFAAGDRGLSVPNDLSVIGFDDIPLAPYVTPRLTTVRQNAIEWGRCAALTLIALVENRPFPEFEMPPVEFIVRSSTGPAPHLPPAVTAPNHDR
ncbi:LacI family DNA-binding transcriptional regulator [Scrofimicrobium canadense]|uniref:LacI family DNA-binding transcriptional regulator n=1 Tax=Scrofimicrobium canadense TaxID=2652290 RepID=UPI00197CD677|nr:LacI family DNA-binding transcriptional regulator [Scrofimicrobium canadense]